MNYKQLLEELLKQYHNGDIEALNLNQSKQRYEISYRDTKNNDGQWMNFSFPTESYIDLLTSQGTEDLEVVSPKKLITSTEYIESNMSDESKEKIKENTNNLLKQTKLTLDKVYPIPGDILRVVDWVGLEQVIRQNNRKEKYEYWAKVDKFVVEVEEDGYPINLCYRNAMGGYNAIWDNELKFFEIIGNETSNSPQFERGDKIACIDEEGFCSVYPNDNQEILEITGSEITLGERRGGYGPGGFYIPNETGLSRVIVEKELKYFRKLR